MVISTPDTTLSSNDKRILNALFDPETLPSSVARSKDAASIDTSVPPYPSIPTTQLTTLEAQQNAIIRNISTQTDNTTSLDSAITELEQIIHDWPTYPSAYLNRAMIQRMRLEALASSTKSLFSAPAAETNLLFTDLSRAIQLCLPAPSHPSFMTSAPVTVSPYQARILKTAYSHRAYLYLKAAETGASLEQGQSKGDLEELASRDFAGAARFGDEVAREMSVRTNPYAKMCGAIVRNALREERKGEII